VQEFPLLPVALHASYPRAETLVVFVVLPNTEPAAVGVALAAVPVAPVAPVAPVGPVLPVGPVGPVAPALVRVTNPPLFEHAVFVEQLRITAPPIPTPAF